MCNRGVALSDIDASDLGVYVWGDVIEYEVTIQFLILGRIDPVNPVTKRA